MSRFSADMESVIESELIDLGTISMRALREWNDAVLRQALRHVMHQASHPRVTVGGGSTERLD
jgi:hypothetical protein